MPHAPVQRADRHQFLVADLQVELVVTVVAALQVQRRGTLGRRVVRVRRVPLHRIAPSVGGNRERLVEHHRERVPTLVPVAHVRRVRQLRLGPLARVDGGVPVADLEPPRRPVARSTVGNPQAVVLGRLEVPLRRVVRVEVAPKLHRTPGNGPGTGPGGCGGRGVRRRTLRVAAVVVFRELEVGCRVTLDSAGVGGIRRRRGSGRRRSGRRRDRRLGGRRWFRGHASADACARLGQRHVELRIGLVRELPRDRSAGRHDDRQHPGGHRRHPADPAMTPCRRHQAMSTVAACRPWSPANRRSGRSSRSREVPCMALDDKKAHRTPRPNLRGLVPRARHRWDEGAERGGFVGG